MKKLLALNWKKSQSLESAQELVSVVDDVSLMYNEYETILLPGDEVLPFLESDISLGTQDFSTWNSASYCVLGHMSRRRDGETDEEIWHKLSEILKTDSVPILCIWPVEPTDTLKTVLDSQLAILDFWPIDREIVIAYEPSFAVGTGNPMTLDDIEIIFQVLSNMLASFTSKHIIYWWSVTASNIADIMKLTDGVIVGKASQEKVNLLSLYIALGES